MKIIWLRVKNTYERVVYRLIRDIYTQKMLLGIITYTFLSDLNTFLSDLIKFLRIVSHILIALAYENPELFHLICVLSVLSVLGIFSVVLLIVNIYKISRRLVDFFFRKFTRQQLRQSEIIHGYIDISMNYFDIFIILYILYIFIILQKIGKNISLLCEFSFFLNT